MRVGLLILVLIYGVSCIVIPNTNVAHTALNNTYQYTIFEPIDSVSVANDVTIEGIIHMDSASGGFDRIVFDIRNTGAGSTTIVNNQGSLPLGSYPIVTGKGDDIFYDGDVVTSGQKLYLELVWNPDDSVWQVVNIRIGELPIMRVHAVGLGQPLAIWVRELVEFDTVDERKQFEDPGLTNTFTIPMTGHYNVRFYAAFAIPYKRIGLCQVELWNNGVIVERMVQSTRELTPKGNSGIPLSLIQDGFKFSKGDNVTLRAVCTNTAKIEVVTMSMSWYDLSVDGN
jgi:hypothetical protein